MVGIQNGLTQAYVEYFKTNNRIIMKNITEKLINQGQISFRPADGKIGIPRYQIVLEDPIEVLIESQSPSDYIQSILVDWKTKYKKFSNWPADYLYFEITAQGAYYSMIASLAVQSLKEAVVIAESLKINEIWDAAAEDYLGLIDDNIY